MLTSNPLLSVKGKPLVLVNTPSPLTFIPVFVVASFSEPAKYIVALSVCPFP